mmetsp:Transcript_12658/g.27966  ORF Transcript_12658/g.27966 Transcript_12658/m.27966 type:complete len:126 (+) Transcript_12658:142-519(+)
MLMFLIIVPFKRSDVYVTMVYVCWCIAENIRYPFYATSVGGFCPKFLQWLRYSQFIVFYPLGFVSEIGVIIAATIKKKQNMFGIDIRWLIASYLFIIYGYYGPQLYWYMFRQRRKSLQIKNRKSA